MATVSKPSDNEYAAAGNSSDSSAEKDIIPIPVLIGIFAAVLAIIVWLMASAWTVEWNRYLSLKAMRKQDYSSAIPPLLWLNIESKDNPTFQSELGVSYLALKDYDNAIKWLELAQKNRTNLPLDDQNNPREAVDFSYLLGRAFLGKGDMAAAEKHFVAALKHQKLEHSANYHMGEIEMKRHNYVKAADYFKVVAREPYFEPLVKKYYAEIEQKLFATVDDDDTSGPLSSAKINS